MKDYIVMLASVVGAFVLVTLLGQVSHSLVRVVNIFSLVVVYFAVEKGEVTGACLGAACGLLQDSFSLGVFGVAGIAKTVMGFLAGYSSARVNILPLGRNFVFILILVTLELIIWMGLTSVVFSEPVNFDNGLLFFQPLVTTILGAGCFAFLRKHLSPATG
ncbi:MAG: rod shape-determining protein MreD [Candidatus Aminicenantales bacterium]